MSEFDDSIFEKSKELCKSHRNLLNVTKERLKRVLAVTPFLDDITTDVTNYQIADEIAILTGESIKIYVKREPYRKLKVIVPARHTTIAQLKSAIQRSFSASQRRQRRHHQSSSRAECRQRSGFGETISWKYIWRTYYLQFNGTPITDDTKTIKNYDILNKSVLNFVKCIKVTKKLKKNQTKSIE